MNQESSNDHPDGRRDTVFRFALNLLQKGVAEGEVLAMIEAYSRTHQQPPLTVDELRAVMLEAIEFRKRTPAPGDKAIVIPLSDVEAAEPIFLHRPYLLRGAVNFIAGPPGTGKSYLALDACARLTTGRNLFDVGIPGWRGNIPGRAVVMSLEDPLAVIRLRFDRLGGNAERVHAFSSKEDGDRDELVSLARDLPLIERVMHDERPDVLVIDNLAGFLGAKVDMHRSNQVRPILAQLTRLAEETDACVLIAAHFNKGERDKALEKLQGSGDFAAAARSVLFVDHNPEHPPTSERIVSVMVQVKCSYAGPGQPLGFVIDDAGLTWTGPVEVTAGDLMVPEREREPGAVEEFLREFLADGPKPSGEVYAAGNQRGFKPRTLRKFKTRLKVTHQYDGKHTVWVLPEGGTTT